MPKIYREGVKLVKTMIYLEEDVHLRLKHLAVDERLSMAELIRRAVDEYLKKYPVQSGLHYCKADCTTAK